MANRIRVSGFRFRIHDGPSRQQPTWWPSPSEAASRSPQGDGQRSGVWLNRRALGLLAPQMLVEPRHDFHEVARAVPVIELVHQNLIPGVLAGAGRSGQTENVSRAGDAGGGARLDRRGADLRETHDQKQRRERLHLFFEQRLDRFWRDVAASEPGSAGGDDDVDHRIGDPGLAARADRLDVVGYEAALGDDMSGRYDALH